ncbi:unnamed protein product [Paramecium pentaurelia]|uniref:START domain-containing protein n=1 Tax=Paramecium pentaurelia TaxID=43138 RepID=A0A8S1TEM6_9CILI|nr:unnamed protein product [Paramecium pentaurelia]
MQINYEQILEETKTKVLTLSELTHENQWIQDSNKDGCSIHTKMNPQNELKINRIEANVDVEPETFINLVTNMTRKKEYDSNFEEGRIIEKIDQNTTIYYARGKPPIFIVDARDFCMITRIYKLGDSHYLAVSKSIEHPQAPLVKGIQRAEMIFAGWIVKKLPNGKTNIIMIGHMNPKGDIPKALVNQGAKFQVEGLNKALNYLNKNRQ